MYCQWSYNQNSYNINKEININNIQKRISIKLELHINNVYIIVGVSWQKQNKIAVNFQITNDILQIHFNGEK